MCLYDFNRTSESSGITMRNEVAVKDVTTNN
jgi:hypothetical protein